MKLYVLGDTLSSIYYNSKYAKLTPNAPKNAKKCELMNFYLLSTFSGFRSCMESLSHATFSHRVPALP